jgi:Mrp family chromosome partitioning ATPase
VKELLDDCEKNEGKMKRVRGTDMVSKTEAAKILGVSLKTLYNMEADGRIEAKTFEGRPAYLVNDLYRNMPAVIGVINQKGGAGKTTLSICLADFFSSLGKRVLCVDLDPQAALSINLLPEEEVVEGKTLADHFNDPNNYRLERIVRKTVYQNIEVLPTVYAMAKHEHTQDREMLEYAKNWKKFLGNYGHRNP